MPSFITFGCWNNLFYNDRCSGSECYRDEVIGELNDYVREHTEVTDIMISGDNYYQNKLEFEMGDGKEKKYNQLIIQDIHSGFSLLRNAAKEIPIHMVYGNHDLLYVNKTFIIEDEYIAVRDNGYNKDALPSSIKPELLNMCIIRDEEDSAARNNRINLRFNYFSKYGEHTLILMIDTSMYSDDFEKIKLCYRGSMDREELQRGQNSEILGFIGEHLSRDSEIKNIIVIGHHPIIYRKFKKGKLNKSSKSNTSGSNIVSYEPKLANLFIQIHKLLSGQSIYYLCADFHVFEHGKITISDEDGDPVEVNQYIVGTGGAKLDKLHQEGAETPPLPIGIDYEPISSRSKHGFLVCNDPGNGDFTFEFIGLRETGKGLKRRKTRKLRKTRRRRHRRSSRLFY